MTDDSLFHDLATEIFTLAGVSKERNAPRFVECQEILRTRMEELDREVKKENCSLQERNELWDKEIQDLVRHLRHMLMNGEISP